MRNTGIGAGLPAEVVREAGMPPPRAASAPTPGDRVELATGLDTRWGYGPNENAFNELILLSIAERWPAPPALPPLLLKSTVAQESAFDPNARSRAGYVGLLQLGEAEARSQGLKLEPVDERTIPAKNVPAGVSILAIKHGVVRDPLSIYPDKEWAQKVAAYYQREGAPSERQLWFHSLAAYNGGGGTVLRAMAHAIDRGLDPREWDRLIQGGTRSPLYAGVRDVYGPDTAPSKFREMSRYPVQIMERAELA